MVVDLIVNSNTINGEADENIERTARLRNEAVRRGAPTWPSREAFASRTD